jgi:CDP-diacylglycerol--glycerol-3-phosphate 3-phosphatidyltransferase
MIGVFRPYFLKHSIKRAFTTCAARQSVFDTRRLKPLQPLQKYAPTFYTKGDNIKPLYEPATFYSELKVK